MTHPNLLRLGRSCAKWRSGFLLVATLFLTAGRPRVAAPNRVTDLRVSAVTDSALIVTWTEASSNGAGVAKYVLRAGPFWSFSWSSSSDIKTGGCAAPVYGSTGGGGRTRSCALTGLGPDTMYSVQLVAYTGTLNTSTVVFGPLSNVAQGVTATRIGSLLVLARTAALDSVRLTQVEFSDWPGIRWPIRGAFWSGDHLITGYNGDSVVARGYLLVTRP